MADTVFRRLTGLRSGSGRGGTVRRRGPGWSWLLILAAVGWIWAGLQGTVLAQSDVEEPSAQSLTEYTVQEGDTLLGIALQLNVPLEVLRGLNDLDADAGLIIVGQTLLVPPRTVPDVPPCTRFHTVAVGDSLWGIALANDMTLETLSDLNDIENPALIAEGRILCLARSALTDGTSQPVDFPWTIQATESFWYTVNLGDDLAWIALRYGKPEALLRSANELDADAEPVPGQLIWIPGHDALAEGPTRERPWAARYFPVADLTGEPTLERYEEGIAYNWFNGSPDPALPADSFSAEWRGEFEFAGGTYRFVGVADHGVRLYLDGEPILDHWSPLTERMPYVDLDVDEGSHALRVEYREQTGAALVYVTWFTAPVSTEP